MRYLYIRAGISFPREIVWQLISWFEGLIQKYKQRCCLMVLLPSNLRSLLLKQSPLDVAWWVLWTERTAMWRRVPSKPQKKFSHPLGNSLGPEKVKSLTVKSEAQRTAAHSKQPSVTNKQKEDKQKLFKESDTLKQPQINMGSLFPKDKYLKVI